MGRPGDHRLSRTTKLRLYRVCVCSSLTHCCKAWTLNRAVIQSVNRFNCTCLHIMTGEHYRVTETTPAYYLALAAHRRLLRYLAHVLRMSADSMVRSALMKPVKTLAITQRAACSVTARASRCHNLWQWRRIV